MEAKERIKEMTSASNSTMKATEADQVNTVVAYDTSLLHGGHVDTININTV